MWLSKSWPVEISVKKLLEKDFTLHKFSNNATASVVPGSIWFSMDWGRSRRILAVSANSAMWISADLLQSKKNQIWNLYCRWLLVKAFSVILSVTRTYASKHVKSTLVSVKCTIGWRASRHGKSEPSALFWYNFTTVDLFWSSASLTSSARYGCVRSL